MTTKQARLRSRFDDASSGGSFTSATLIAARSKSKVKFQEEKSEKYANYLFISADICIRMGFVTCIMGK